MSGKIIKFQEKACPVVKLWHLRYKGLCTTKPQPKFYYRVWRKTTLIPRGRVTTYAALARAVGRPRAARAVGNALHRNPYQAVPCHRVICSDGRVGGYANGARAKVKLLKSEGVKIARGRTDPRDIILRLP